MLFSSTIFLFAFLPVVLTACLLVPGVRARNGLLLAASLVFYAWGETVYVAVLLLSIAVNYVFGLWLAGGGSRTRLALAVGANLALLGFFKYANFVVDNVDVALAGAGLPTLSLAPVHLPIGISFFTFQALTYVVDVHRRTAPVQRNPLRLALYTSLFPQLIAGPIVRYADIADQLAIRAIRSTEVAQGVQRFVVGLAKKVLVANTLAVPADRIFALQAAELSPAVAWLGLLCYALQIYFDFSGYTDMAIGLGRCFGFGFPENFRHPYVSRSLREFWRRWHITLSTWFRDYLYLPLGGNRRGSWRTAANLVAVFLLCGLWHGASWNFVVWGALHGGFMALERGPFGRLLGRLPRAFAHLYALAVVSLAWVFFRTDDLAHALAYLGALFSPASAASLAHPLVLYLDRRVLLMLVVGAIGSTPWWPVLRRWLPPRPSWRPAGPWLPLARVLALDLLFVLCAMSLAAGTHNPFIYFRF